MGLPEKLLLILGSCDDYEDHVQWVVGAIDAGNREAVKAAKKWVERANALSTGMGGKWFGTRQAGLIELGNQTGDDQVAIKGSSYRWWPEWMLTEASAGIPIGDQSDDKV